MIKVPQEDRQLVGEIIRDKRKARKMSLKDLGDKVKMNQGNLSRIESGLSSVNYEKLTKIAILLEIPEVFTITGLPMPEYFLHNYKEQHYESNTEEYEDLKAYKDHFEEFNSLKHSSYNVIDSNAIQIILNEGTNIGLDKSFLRINPFVRNLVIERIFVAINAFRRTSELEKELYLALTDISRNQNIDIYFQQFKTQISDLGFWRGYFQGIKGSMEKLRYTLKDEGLYWLLAGFLPPEDALLLDTFYDKFKDNPPEEKEKLAEALKGFLELYQTINNRPR